MVISKNELKGRIIDSGQKRSYEYLEILFPAGNKSTRMLIIYRPQRDTDCKLVPLNVFFDEFQEHMERVILSPGQLIISGDFNIHVNKHDDPNTITCQICFAEPPLHRTLT